MDFVNPGQVNVAEIEAIQASTGAVPDTLPIYDRPIKVEMWYPAKQDSKGDHLLSAMLRNGDMITLQGQGIKDAQPVENKTFPLVIISHGYPGNRYLLSPIAENLASKGYVVAAIDHVDSTYDTKIKIDSSLINRPYDQAFVLDKMAELSQDSDSFLKGLVDANNTAIIGYSMGGYGTLVSIGAGINQSTAESFPLAAGHLAGSAEHQSMRDSRIKVAVTFAPAGTKHQWIDDSALADISVPVLYIAGSEDPTVGYEDGVRKTWLNTTSVERSLLTFVGAGHCVGAPMPAPIESYQFDSKIGMNLSKHYTDPVWSNIRMNNVSTHFISAWLGKYLNKDSAMNEYLNISVDSDDSWTGFPTNTARMMKFESLTSN